MMSEDRPLHGQDTLHPGRTILRSGHGAAADCTVEIEGADAHAPVRRITIRGPGPTVIREVTEARHPDYLALFAEVAQGYGLRAPVSHEAPPPPPLGQPLHPVLTEPVSPSAPYGYGDPSVIRVETSDGPAWYLLATSNDAPDAFPILRSIDLLDWRLAGHVFPAGATPAWAVTGENVADFWAPEMHRVGEEFWVCFAARGHDHELAIGLAKAQSPEGPFEAAEQPLITGGVIDPHILISPGGDPLLLWKVDSNGVWPRLLAGLLHGRPDLAMRLFPDPADRKTAALLDALWPWVRTLEPMEAFFLLQPLIEAVTADFAGARSRLRDLAADPEAGMAHEANAILHAMRTRIYAQPIARDGASLLGEPVTVVENDAPWEAHLIEGVWVVAHGDRHYLFYAGNDFSTAHYGIGAAVSEAPLGPYRKLDRPILQSSSQWWGPGHPSVAIGPDGRHRMFLHAFFPGEAAYKAFRALLTCEVEFDGDEIRLKPPPARQSAREPS